MPPPPDIRGIYRSDSRARAAYAEGAGIYRIIPQAVCLPADIEDLKGLISWAATHRVPLVPRGAGSAMAGGNVGDGVVVDLTRMPRRLEVDGASARAVTSACVTHTELNQAAARHGFRLPPDPSSGRWATLGGMVSTNAAGAKSVRYGSVRRWVQGLSLVTADGESVSLRRGSGGRIPADSAALARFESDAAPALHNASELIASRFPRTRKNSSGYALDAYLASGDVLELLIGAEGTLGVITGIEWRLDAVPTHRAGLRVSLSSLDHLGKVVAALNHCEPSALELLDRTFLDLLEAGSLAAAGLAPGSEAILLVELERGDRGRLKRDVDGAAAAVRPWADSTAAAFSLPEAERLWSIRHAASPILAGLPEDRRSLQVIEDACVPLDAMGEYISLVRRAGAERHLSVVMFGHAGDGHVHVNLLPQLARPGWESDVASLLEEVTEAVVRLGGTPSGEHGDGRLRSATLGRVYGADIVELFHRVKRAFDPLGILNPGIILPSGEPPISRLKVGANAASLPPDIQLALREIESAGGYGRCRLDLAGEAGSQESGVRSSEPPTGP
ncbi:MAG: FAD-binding oxidoreductase [Gemmatimonadales bacterium]